MSFDDEWAQHKNAAMERQSSSTRLNQLPVEPGGGGSRPDLATAPARKKAAANTIEKDVQPGVKAAADAGDAGTDGAVAEFKGWDTASGLKKAHEHWDGQVKRLMARLDSEKAGLREMSSMFKENDIVTGAGFAPTRSKVSGV
ncbi:hypothetical protein ACFUT3_21780 [Streptomyces cinereoruber]|uniref:hypothetical protein n=1 Tax=Streptomyces cinereoruber TaxID=67260 RepID=UPI00362CF888